NPDADAADFTANISWGDGSTTDGTVTADPSGGFDVSGTHAYNASGVYTISVSIEDDGGSTANATSTATVTTVATTTTLATSLNTPASGQPVTLTATVSPVTPTAFPPTGSVTFYYNNTLADFGTPALTTNDLVSLGTATLVNGVATLTTTALPVG